MKTCPREGQEVWCFLPFGMTTPVAKGSVLLNLPNDNGSVICCKVSTGTIAVVLGTQDIFENRDEMLTAVRVRLDAEHKLAAARIDSFLQLGGSMT